MILNLGNCNTIELDKACALVIPAGSASRIITVRGTLWVTSDRNRDDTILESGMSIELPASGTTYLTAIGVASIRVIEAPTVSWRHRFDRLVSRWATARDTQRSIPPGKPIWNVI